MLFFGRGSVKKTPLATSLCCNNGLTLEKSFVILEWVDSAEGDGWTNLDHALRDDPVTIQSIGILLRKPTKDNPYYIICRDFAEDVENCCGVMRIPKVSVVRMDEFYWPEGFERGFYDAES
jgi:hypothetical protein